jgi:HK97 family phage major capsid protein
MTLSRKADIALANLTNDGGILAVEQQNSFYRYLIDQPTLLGRMRTVQMANPTMEINKIGFNTRILRAARQSGGQENDGSNGRALPKAERSSPDLGKIELVSKEVQAEVRIPYEVLEDNIERGDMSNTVLSLIGERASLDLEELVLVGDTTLAGSDAYLGLFNGALKRVTANTVNGTDYGITAELFNETKKALPTAYRRNPASLSYFVHPDIESDYRLAVSNRGTGLGDAILTGTQALPVFGSPMTGVANMPEDSALYCNPRNLIFGIQRNVRIEQDRDIRSREVIIVLTARVATAIEDQLGVVKVTNIGAVTPPEEPEGGGT